MMFPGCRLAISCLGMALAAAMQPAMAEGAVSQATFCMADGTKITAERFEAKDGNFLLYVAGSAAPLIYPATSVRGINSDCPEPDLVPQAIHFGVHGSNTIGERLMPALIEAFAEKRYGSRPIVKSGKPEEEQFTIRKGTEPKGVVELQAHGSGTAVAGLVSGDAQIGMASRQLKAPEAATFRSRFNVDPLAPGNEHVLALDGLAVIVNPSNSVKEMNLEQMARVFSGNIKNWRELGGADLPIKVLRRDGKSGTFDTFKSLVLDPLNLPIASSAQQFESSENLSAAVAQDPDAIGFVAVPYIDKNKALRIASPCGLVSSPTRFSIKSEEYPLARRLFLYTVGVPQEPLARDLLQFALSDDAQSIVSENGFLDQRVEFEDASEQESWAQSMIAHPNAALDRAPLVPGSALADFKTLTQSSRRTSLVYRFAFGKSDLDTRALQDIDRLANYIRSNPTLTRHTFIVGFTDSNGGWRRNERLALQRATAVANLLQRAGVDLPRKNLVSFSYLAPVACNDTDAGTAKNRRVEVWIRN